MYLPYTVGTSMFKKTKSSLRLLKERALEVVVKDAQCSIILEGNYSQEEKRKAREYKKTLEEYTKNFLMPAYYAQIANKKR
jgi:hypothetical protein